MESCLKLLRGPSDEERFVGLLFVVKLLQKQYAEGVDPGVHINQLREIYTAVGWEFLRRMLQTPGTAITGQEGVSYAELATSIIAALCSDPEGIACHPELWAQIPTFCGLASTNASPALIDDVLKIFASISCVSGGVSALSQHDVLPVIYQHIIPSVFQQTSPAAGKISALVALIQRILEQRHSDSSTTLVHYNVVAPALISLCRFARHDHTAAKFTVFDLLSMTFAETEPSSFRGAELPFIEDLRTALFEVFSCKVAAIHREAALHLTSALLDRLGQEWAVIPPGDAAPSRRGQFVELLLELTRIELLMQFREASYLLDITERRAIAAEPYEESTQRRSAIISSCLSILVDAIFFLVEENAPSSNSEKMASRHWADVLPAEALLRFRRALSEVFDAAIEYVHNLSTHGDNALRTDHITIVVAVMRFIGTWAAEDPEVPCSRVWERLPFLLDVSERAVARNASRGEQRTDPFEYLLPCLTALDETQRATLLAECKDHPKLQRHFHEMYSAEK